MRLNRPRSWLCNAAACEGTAGAALEIESDLLLPVRSEGKFTFNSLRASTEERLIKPMRNKFPCCLLMPDIYRGLTASRPAGEAGAEAADVCHSGAGAGEEAGTQEWPLRGRRQLAARILLA